MKTIFKKVAFVFVLMFMAAAQTAKAESTVYFFVDFRFWNSEYIFTLNGEKAFSLVPEGKAVSSAPSAPIMYNMVMRKVIFKNPDSYVVGVDCSSARGTYHAELNLNLEDGETYYVVVNASMKKTFYIENLEEKAGLKLLKKAQKSKKYTINEDFVYEGK